MQTQDTVIYTERLRLHTPTLEDAEFIQREFPKWDIVKNLTNSVPWPYPSDGAAFFLNDVLLPNIAQGKDIAFIIEVQNSDTSIGLVHFFSKKDGRKGVERAFWLGLDFHGKGYMTEAANAANDWLFNNTEADAIYANNAAENKRSKRVKEKQGFEFLGEFDMPTRKRFHDGQEREDRWVLTKEKWQQQK